MFEDHRVGEKAISLQIHSSMSSNDADNEDIQNDADDGDIQNDADDEDIQRLKDVANGAATSQALHTRKASSIVSTSCWIQLICM